MALAFAGDPGGAAQRAAAAVSARSGEPVGPWRQALERPRALFADARSEAGRWAIEAGVPVIAVRNATAFEAWSRGERELRATVVVDPDPTAIATIRLGLWLAGAGGTSLSAIHSYGPFEARWHYGLPTAAPAAQVESLIERDLRELMADAGAHDWLLELAGAVEKRSDHVAELVRAARPDLVVIANDSGLAETLLGAGIAAVASVPATLATAPPRPFRTILVPTDLTPRALPSIAEAASIVAPDGLVHLVHFHRPGETLERQRAELERGLRLQVPNVGPGRLFRTSWALEAADHTARGIAQSADRLGADLVCVSTHARRGLRSAIAGSVVRDLVGLLDKPMLVVPVREDG